MWPKKITAQGPGAGVESRYDSTSLYGSLWLEVSLTDSLCGIERPRWSTKTPYRSSYKAVGERFRLSGQHVAHACTIRLEKNETQAKVLFDTGASAEAFIDRCYANQHHIPLTALDAPRELQDLTVSRPVGI